MREKWSKLGPFTVGQGKGRLNFRHLLLSLSRDQDCMEAAEIHARAKV